MCIANNQINSWQYSDIATQWLQSYHYCLQLCLATWSHTGHMFMLHDGFVLCYQLFCSGTQPANKLSIHADILKDTKLCPTVMTVEPVTGTLVIRTPGSLRVAQPE
ncbi:hypothetical protein DFH11DRAFT_1630686 [Phellopilus nigrolimitatus]|nr:hypothetical protein DFH11DRAFT_1630686 [Phellopilus nigrolimitatus]